jgi:C1A family cysteine protease
MKKISIPLKLAAITILCLGITAGADVGPEIQEAPVNPFFSYYQNFLNDALKGEFLIPPDATHYGEIPSPVDRSHVINVVNPIQIDWYPTSYDLRTMNKLTSIKNQGACGSCWTFATMASLESYGKPTNDWNFSEQDANVNNGFDIGECSGGNQDMATAYLARWDGPLSETDVPYPYGDGSPAADIIIEGFSPQKHVQQVIFIPQRSSSLDNDTIKYFISTYGAAYVSFYYSSSYIDASDLSFYNNVNTNTNHAVAAVGWDDDYSASNFRPDRQPPGNGAFLIRNSWGTGRHDNGYFWISYYDTSFIPRASLNNAESPDNYNTNYQYDPLGHISNSGYGSTTAWGANIFTAVGNSTLKAVGYHTNDANTNYEIYIYKGVTPGYPTSGSLEATASGSQVYPGYYTAVLATPVSLSTDDVFSVVIKFMNSSYTYPIPIEKVYNGYSSGAVSNPGESFMSSSGSGWTDVYNYGWNVCIKGFAVNTHTISGTVTSGGPGLENVVMSGLPGDPLTTGSGFYTATVDSGWSGTVTPTLEGYDFTDPSTTYNNVTSDQTTDYTSTAVTITVTDPNGGESWMVDSAQAITWTSTGTVGNVKIEYSTNNGDIWTEIIASTANDGTHPWTVPDAVSSQCLVRVSETDGSPSDTSDNVFSIIPIPAITVTSPNGGEYWMMGTAQTITWTTEGTVGNVKIEYSTNNGDNWTEITASTPNDGSHPWTVPGVASTQCLVRISETDGSPSDTSNNVFTIAAFRSIVVTSPNGGENWDVNSSHAVTWTSEGTVGNVMIEYSTDNGASWKTIVESTENDGSYNWTVPNDPSVNCLVRVREQGNDGSPSDVSDAVFSIVAPVSGSITLRSPNGGESWTAGSSHEIVWNSTGDISQVTIKYSLDNGVTWKRIVQSTGNDGSYNWVVPGKASDDCLVRVTANDSDLDPKPSDESDAVFSIVPSSTPSIRVISPNGGEQLVVGTRHTITWDVADSRDEATIEYSTNGGETWTDIAEAVENNGTFAWTIPDTPSETCLVRITEINGQLMDISDTAFSIVTPLSDDITVTVPNGGESWMGGSDQEIKWTSNGVETVKIEYSTDNGTTWGSIVQTTPSDGSFDWTIPEAVSSDECRVRITSTDASVDPIPSDISDELFSITPPESPAVRVITPNGGEQLVIGARYNITWNFADSRDNAKIEYSTNSGETWTGIAEAAQNNGTYSWIIPDIPSETCLVRVTEINSELMDISDTVFSVVTPTTGDITVTAPNGGESWTVNSVQEITWTGNGEINNVTIEYSTDNRTTWIEIVQTTENDGSYDWTVPDTVSDECLVRITANDEDLDPKPTDMSDQLFSIIPEPTGEFRVTAPNGGEEWEVGTVQAITWTGSGSAANVTIDYSTDNGNTWSTIASSAENGGAYDWTIPDTVSDECLVRITANDGNEDPKPTDVSDEVFSIIHPTEPTIRVITPNGGEQLEIGALYEITWFGTETRAEVKIEYSTNGGESWTGITESTENDGDYDWTVPDEPSETCLIRISDIGGQPVDVSDAVFSIVQSQFGDLTVLTPNGGENLETGSEYDITWTCSGLNNVHIEYSTNNGETWTYIDTVSADNGSYAWTVPGTPSDLCLVRVTGADADENPSDISDGVFTIFDPSQAAVEVFTPNGGESLTVNQEYYITWSAAGLNSVKIEYSTDNGDQWTTIDTVDAASGRYTWTVPNTPSEICLVRITGDDSPGDPSDTSDAVFSIVTQ